MTAKKIKKPEGMLKKGQHLISPLNVKASPDVQKQRKISKLYGRSVLDKYSKSTYKELKKKLAKKDDIPCLELLVMRSMEKAISHGDIRSMTIFYDRLYGKPKEEINEVKTIKFNYSLGNKEETSKIVRTIKEGVNGET